MSDPCPPPPFLLDHVRRDLMLKNAMRLAWRKYAKSGTVAWVMVCDICGVGSTYATHICKEIGIDPHKPYKP